MSDVTRILTALEQGDAKAADKLLPPVYEELRRLAAKKLSRESSGQTLQATALVHEAYLRLVGSEARNWKGRTHFLQRQPNPCDVSSSITHFVRRVSNMVANTDESISISWLFRVTIIPYRMTSSPWMKPLKNSQRKTKLRPTATYLESAYKKGMLRSYPQIHSEELARSKDFYSARKSKYNHHLFRDRAIVGWWDRSKKL
ncbi:MAG: ECF-type sigma factor [Sedimentisphaerales bacterium]